MPSEKSSSDSPTSSDSGPGKENANKALLLVGRMQKEGLLQPKRVYPSLGADSGGQKKK